MMETGIGNLGVAAMMAGYAGKDDITVDVSGVKMPFFTENKERLENFISWLLNEKGCAERTFSVHLSFKEVSPLHQVGFECNMEQLSTMTLATERFDCLALSGGLDSLSSFIALRANDIDPLCSFVDYGQAQVGLERRSLVACQRRFNIPVVSFTVFAKQTTIVSCDGWPIDGFKIPARNFTILSLMNRFIDVDRSISATRSLNYGVYSGEIMDKNHDKSPRFFDEATDIFSSYNGVNTVVQSPVGRMSKVEQLQFLDHHDILDFALNTCRTCITDSPKPCLNCKPCFNRMLSVYVAGFKHRVQDADWKRMASSRVVNEYRDHVNDYTGDRKRDIINFLSFLDGE